MSRQASIGALLLLAGCGGGGVETLPPVDSRSPPGVFVAGQVTKAPLDSAALELLPIDAFGAVSGPAVTTATTLSDGSFTAVIPQGAGTLLIRSSGGSYVDEADREPDPALKRRIVLGAGEGLESLLPEGVNNVAISIATQALLDKSRRETIAGTFGQQFTANRVLATQAFGFDIVSTLPADPISPDPALSQAQRQYAMLLGGLANLVNRVAIDASLAEPDIDSIQAVVADFSDGRIDGMVAGVAVMLGGAPIGVFSINDEIARFRNNNFDAYAGTPLLVVDESVFSQIPSPVNAVPVATDDAFGVNRGAALTITAPGVLANDTDADGNPLTAAVVTPPGNSIAFSLQADGSFSYQHDGGPPGPVTFEYTASDGLAVSSIATVTIDVSNRVPIAVADAITLAEGGVSGGDVLANDTDGDNDPLSALLIDAPVNGALVLAADGTFTYTHNGSETTSDSFTYVANDGFDDSAPATVAITVTPVNDPPTTTGIGDIAVDENSAPVVIDLFASFDDAETPDSLLTFVAATEPDPAVVTTAIDSQAGTLTLVLEPDEFGAAIVTVTATDAGTPPLDVISAFTIVVNGLPQAVDDAYSTTQDTGLVTGDVFANDDLGDQPATITAFDTVSADGATVMLVGDSMFDYQPLAGVSGIDTFSYTLTDANGDSSTATVTVTVSPFRTWIGPDVGQWGDPANWSPAGLPQPGDVVVIDPGFPTFVTMTAIDADILSIQCACNLTVGGASSLTIRAQSDLMGETILQPGATLNAEGPDADLGIAGDGGRSPVIDGANLNALAGALISIADVAAVNQQDTSAGWVADGQGSAIVFSDDLVSATLSGSDNDDRQFDIRAVNQGVIDMPRLETLVVPGPFPDGRTTRIDVLAGGTGSQVLMPSLITFSSADFDGGVQGSSVLTASNGGSIAVPALTQLGGSAINLDAMSSIDTAQLAAIIDGVLTIDGGSPAFTSLDEFRRSRMFVHAGATPVFDNLTELDGSGIELFDASVVTMPSVTNHLHQSGVFGTDAIWLADAGSQLSLPGLTTIAVGDPPGAGSAAAILQLQVLGGGTIVLPAVSGITVFDSFDANPRLIRLIADGPGSLIDLTNLGTLDDQDQDPSDDSCIDELNGGVVSLSPGVQFSGVSATGCGSP